MLALSAALVLAGVAGWLAAHRGDAPPPAAGRAAQVGTPTPPVSTTAQGTARAARVAPQPVANAVRGSATSPSGSVDLSAVMRQVHFAFRPRGGGYAGGHSTYDATLDGGLLEVTPSQGDPVQFSPAAIARGESRIGAVAGVARIGEDGRLEIAKGAVVEELQNGPEGLEQRWRFSGRPAGAGDLEVRIPVANGTLLAENDGGVHLSGGARGVRYGQGTWIDALGVATPVPVRWDAGAVVLSVPSAVLDGSAYPAVLDPVIGPEVAVDAPVYVAATGDQKAPAAAWNGECYLVVWEDARGSSPVVKAARVTSTGTVLDPGGIEVSRAAYSSLPAVASDGTDFFVVWRQGYSAYDIKGARVRADGVVVDTSPVTVSAAANAQDAPAVAWAEGGYVVVWQDGRSGNDDVYGARVTPGGAVLDATGFVVAAQATAERQPAIACEGATCLVAWTDYRAGTFYDVAAARVSAGGVVLDSPSLPIAVRASNQWHPAVAAGGGSYLVAWADDASGLFTVVGARVDSAGVVLDPAGIPIAPLGSATDFPSLAWTGADFLALWQKTVYSSTEIWGARLGLDGIVKDPAGFTLSGAGYSRLDPAAACAGGSCLAVWSDNGSGSYDARAARVTGAGAVLDRGGVVVSNGADEQLAPAVAWNADSSAGAYLVVWQDLRASQGYDIYGVRLSRDGVPLDVAGIPISTATGAQSAPAVSSGGAAGWLVVWDDKRAGAYTDIYGARVTSAGAVQEPNGIHVSSRSLYELSPAVAFDGARWLVVWYDGSGTAFDIYGARVSTAGALLDSSPIPVTTRDGIQAFPSVACSASECLVAWEDLFNGIDSDVYAARVSPAGTLLGTRAIATGAGNQFSTAVARGASGYLVTWVTSNGSYGRDVFAARVAGDGTLLDPAGFAVASGLGDQMSPAVAWDGASFLVAWTAWSSGSSDVAGARVTEAGTVRDPGGFPIAATADAEAHPRLAASGPRRFLAAYERNDPRPPVVATRVFARTISLEAAPTAADQSLTVDEDGSLPVTLAATDPDDDPLTFAVVTPPAHGTLQGTPPDLTYAPDPDYAGTDAFTFLASDGTLQSAPATIWLTVNPVNDPPVASGGSVTTDEDTPAVVALVASDADGDALSYELVRAPSHGTISGAGATLTYTPTADYHGPDSFAFRASDGIATSADAVVSVTVAPVNDPPVATGGTLELFEDGSAELVPLASDVDGDALTFAVVAPASHGTVVSSGSRLIYTPAPDWAGSDAFSFVASDGELDSPPATVVVTVAPVNDPPTAQHLVVSTDEDNAVAVGLIGSDADGDPLSWFVVSPPAHGTLTGTGASLTYTPFANFHGEDSFAYVASDGLVTSDVATATLLVAAVNDPPIAIGQALETSQGRSIPVTLNATDVDGDALTYSVVKRPAHGTLSGSGRTLTYAPARGFHGTDSFTFVAKDGVLTSAPATVTIRVR